MPWKMGQGATLALLVASCLLLSAATGAIAADPTTESDDFEDGYVEDVPVSFDKKKKVEKKVHVSGSRSY